MGTCRGHVARMPVVGDPADKTPEEMPRQISNGPAAAPPFVSMIDKCGWKTKGVGI